MKTKPLLRLLVNGLFLIMLLIAVYNFYQGSILYFEKINSLEIGRHFISGLYFFSVICMLCLVWTLIRFNQILRKWNEKHFFDILIIKSFERLGVFFTTCWILVFAFEFATMNFPFRSWLPSGFLGMGAAGSAACVSIGLLLLFIANTITRAKVLKDENDLTI